MPKSRARIKTSSSHFGWTPERIARRAIEVEERQGDLLESVPVDEVDAADKDEHDRIARLFDLHDELQSVGINLGRESPATMENL